MGEQANDPTYIGFSCIAEQYQRKVRIANKLLALDLKKSQMYPEQKKSQIGWLQEMCFLQFVLQLSRLHVN